MRLLAASLASAGLLAGAPLHVTLSAPTHSPKVNTHWRYIVHVTANGKPVAARITAQIVDPIGGVHPVEFGASKKTVTNWRISGVFRDYVIWPASSRGIPLTFRITVVTGHVRHLLRYTVTSRA